MCSNANDCIHGARKRTLNPTLFAFDFLQFSKRLSLSIEYFAPRTRSESFPRVISECHLEGIVNGAFWHLLELLLELLLVQHR